MQTKELAGPEEATLLAVLSQEERERADRFRVASDRRNYVAAHAGLRVLLAAALGRTASRLEFALNANGKPTLQDLALHFSLSHSGSIVLIALALDVPLGVDVERMRAVADRDAIARSYFHPGEVADLTSLAGCEAELGFFRCWTRKEAVAKASGLGLSLPLDQYRVSCRPEEPAKLLTLSSGGPPAIEWSLFELKPEAGYAAALAVPVRPIELRCHTLDLSLPGSAWH